MSSQRPHRRGTRTVEESTPTEDRATPALAVEGLSKQFGSGVEAVTAVDDVSFRIEQGTVVGLLGPNGAGKTTTIKSVLGLVLPDSGRIRVQGIDMADQPRKAYRHVDAMLEGARNDYWRLTVRENLRYFSTIKGVKPDAVADRHERLLAKLGLLEKADEPVRSLSRGMKQKVSLASVLASESDLVFLDEPTLGLDVESSLTLRRELRRIVDERALTAVVSSHDMDVIEDVCDRVIIMNEGEIIADDSVSAVLDQFTASGFSVTSPDITDSLLSTIRERFEVVEVTSVERGRRVEVTTDSDGFYRLLALCRDHDVTLAGVGTVEPDLEDVFIEITGQGS
ncbi:daunorubicin resistance protein DrrA family ABC transporter ATP-binding protein [Haloarcula mannanilytica]|uniref:Daunorubicin resistance protein DrrA family ABC transporter ATP-binding protein n=1 Tax=Haloarcula mannanilytica TaxID=2509225 RepID=A0A4C2EME6_9EURY|nr:ABC transporter ATP-binding protein [Haloarcula mannanilytica]GCF13793.1 daunorubicin resistance protein DrrA family ABC transporter ATP-binding protein [Haloarcula mannanilytica]